MGPGKCKSGRPIRGDSTSSRMGSLRFMRSPLLDAFALIDGFPVNAILGGFNGHADAVGRVPSIDDALARLLARNRLLSVFDPGVAVNVHARNEGLFALFSARIQLVMPVAAIGRVVGVHDEGLDSLARPDVAERAFEIEVVGRPAAVLVPGERARLARLRLQRLA